MLWSQYHTHSIPCLNLMNKQSSSARRTWNQSLGVSFSPHASVRIPDLVTACSGETVSKALGLAPLVVILLLLIFSLYYISNISYTKPNKIFSSVLKRDRSLRSSNIKYHNNSANPHSNLKLTMAEKPLAVVSSTLWHITFSQLISHAVPHNDTLNVEPGTYQDFGRQLDHETFCGHPTREKRNTMA